MSATTRNKPTIGLPPEQLRQWLEWVREDLHQITARVDYMLAEQARLTEQERLLGQLLDAVAGAPTPPEGSESGAMSGASSPPSS
jgi:hypothetical protein